ncbi:hypothetical protein L596_006096 [Steinernema carpocapsae]|uniref:Uncharacterized protein n=1 Tax=Steinernema carpocapsae TaxID=34508 RepID=A0A4U8V876_STECR|nr:hypothetical protein L596_006096 [Steinernema carpocapsae]
MNKKCFQQTLKKETYAVFTKYLTHTWDASGQVLTACHYYLDGRWKDLTGQFLSHNMNINRQFCLVSTNKIDENQIASLMYIK